MPEANTFHLNRAARDVIAERQRQVSAEGYSLDRDDHYVKCEMADAAAAYATCAGRPQSMTTLWPWAESTFKPSSDRRRDLVKATALLLAEIERLDRIGLIRSWPVKRDELGFFQHPDLPDFGEDAVDAERCKAWIAEQGLEVSQVRLEYHSDEAVSERYAEAGDPDCSYWQPDRPEGDGWFCLAIHDTEDGPVCWWGRRVETP